MLIIGTEKLVRKFNKNALLWALSANIIGN